MAAAFAFAWRESAPGARFAGTALALARRPWRAVSHRDRRLRRVQPDALDFGYPPGRAGRRPPFARDAPVYQIAMYDQTLPFYLGRTTTLVAFRDELALGIDAEPERQIPTRGGMDRALARAADRVTP